MPERVLITGGAGFIGSHVADELLAAGYRVRTLDSLEPQVHGENEGAADGQPDRRWPAYLAASVERVCGEVGDPETVRTALADVDAVIHLAAAVGVGQSMYEPRRYTRINDLGTSTLLEALIQQPVRRLIVASSMSIYGEGRWVDAQGRAQHEVARSLDQLRAHHWEPRDAQGRALHPEATPETTPPQLASVYALGKYFQEQACLIVGRAYRIPTIALRLFNVYGPRQALSNPYTGVLAIFASRLLNGKPPLIFEDGGQRRDFVHVSDVAQAFRLALEAEGMVDEVHNIGSGQSYTVREVAERLQRAMGVTNIEPRMTQEYRVGDVRHCFGDISKACQQLGYTPQMALEAGLAGMNQWLSGARARDHVDSARHELARRGLTV